MVTATVVVYSRRTERSVQILLVRVKYLGQALKSKVWGYVVTKNPVHLVQPIGSIAQVGFSLPERNRAEAALEQTDIDFDPS